MTAVGVGVVLEEEKTLYYSVGGENILEITKEINLKKKGLWVMSKTIKVAYGRELEKGYDYRGALEEANRCLLCYEAPCSRSCPAGTDPGKFIRSLRFHNVMGAAATIRLHNPLGGVCAQVCPQEQLCQEGCSRSGIDKPIKIGRLQRFLVEEEARGHWSFLTTPKAHLGKVACVGAGPAGLSCARELALLGYQVTVFDKEIEPGGMLTYAIPPSRLANSLVEHDVKLIKELGVSFKMGESITPNKLSKLQKEYQAVFLAVGMQEEKALALPGSQLEGVIGALAFLRAAKKLELSYTPGTKVIVIGGGDVALDCAMTAKQLGGEATIVYRRTIEEAPADAKALAEVQAMGIPFLCQFAPKEILGVKSKLVGLKAQGRDEQSELFLAAEQLIIAIGQGLSEDFVGFKEEGNVFLGGDMSSAKDHTVVEAVASGKQAAEKIHTYLTGGAGA